MLLTEVGSPAKIILPFLGENNAQESRLCPSIPRMAKSTLRQRVAPPIASFAWERGMIVTVLP